MIARCWIHIGTEKTGSTSIQEFLATNRAELRHQGILYPVAPGKSNHIGLTCFALDDHKVESNRTALGVIGETAVAKYREKLLSDLTAEVQAAKPRAIVLSNEHLSGRVSGPSELQRLKGLCDRIARQTTVIVYLRNQVDFLVSRYIEAVKGGSIADFPFPLTKALSRLMDYSVMLEPWRTFFGTANLDVRLFEPEEFTDNDLLMDFASIIGADKSKLQKTSRHNEALDADSIAFLREFNRHVPHKIDGRRNPLRGRIVQELECLRTDRKYCVSREIASAIEADFAQSNRAVASEYLPGRPLPLFRPPRAVQAENSGPAQGLSPAGSIRLAAQLWMAQQEKLNAANQSKAR